MKNLFFILAILGACSPAYAQTEKTVVLQTAVVLGPGVSQAARTSTGIAVANHNVLRLSYFFTRSTGTDMAIHCESSNDNSTNWAHIDVPDSDGILTAGAALFSYAALVVSRDFDVRLGVGAFRFVRCYPTVDGAGAGDLMSSSYTIHR